MEPDSTSIPNSVASQPGQGPVVYIPATSTLKTNDHFAPRLTFGLGIGQIIAGCICIVCQSVSFAYATGWSLIAHGIWSGLVFILTGAFGLYAIKKKTNHFNATYLLMCIISAVVATGVTALSIFGSVAASAGKWYFCTGVTRQDNLWLACQKLSVEVPMQACIAAAACIEIILCICGAVLFRKSGKGCCSTSQRQVMVSGNNFTHDHQVLYMNQTHDTPYVYAQPSAYPYPQGQMQAPAYQTSFVQPPWSSPSKPTPISAVSPDAPLSQGTHPPSYPPYVAANHQSEKTANCYT